MTVEVVQHKFKAKERFQLYFKCLKILRLSTFNFLIIHLVLISCSDKHIQKEGHTARVEAICSFERLLDLGTQDYQRCIQEN